MRIHTTKSSFLIQGDGDKKGCVFIKSDSNDELHRFFGSLVIEPSGSSEYPFQVRACKQEFANALILMVKEIDYTVFSEFEPALI
ncbi:MAG: hypothetical protein PSV36_09830 [Algoriphagus sp.]|nr:hypothetical protein [Algoriphagus sp.]